MVVYIVPAAQFVGHLPDPEVDIVLHEHIHFEGNSEHPEIQFNYYIFCSFCAFITINLRNRAPIFRLHCRIWYHGHHPGINSFSQAINDTLILTQEEASNPQLAFARVCSYLYNKYNDINTPTDTSSSEED